MKKSIYTLLFLITMLFVFGSFVSINFSYAMDINSGNGQAATSNVFETNAFRLIRQIDATGKIGLAYVFPVNSKELVLQGYSEAEINTYKFYLTTYVNALAQNNKQKEIDGVSVSGCNYYTDVDGLGFSIIFDNIDAQNRFYGVGENDGSSSGKNSSSGFFIKTTKMQTNFPFSEKSAGDVKLICTMAISSWANDLNLTNAKKTLVLNTLNNSKFIYDFGSLQTSLKSDLMYDDGNFHHNVFIKTFEDTKNNPNIVFWTKTPNYPVWYASAVIVVVAGMITAFVVLKIKKIKKNN